MVLQPVRRADGSWESGGFLLELCGVDGAGDAYHSEMLVFEASENRLISINTLYWLGMKIARGPVTGLEPGNPPCPS